MSLNQILSELFGQGTGGRGPMRARVVVMGGSPFPPGNGPSPDRDPLFGDLDEPLGGFAFGSGPSFGSPFGSPFPGFASMGGFPLEELLGIFGGRVSGQRSDGTVELPRAPDQNREAFERCLTAIGGVMDALTEASDELLGRTMDPYRNAMTEWRIDSIRSLLSGENSPSGGAAALVEFGEALLREMTEAWWPDNATEKLAAAKIAAQELIAAFSVEAPPAEPTGSFQINIKVTGAKSDVDVFQQAVSEHTTALLRETAETIVKLARKYGHRVHQCEGCGGLKVFNEGTPTHYDIPLPGSVIAEILAKYPESADSADSSDTSARGDLTELEVASGS